MENKIGLLKFASRFERLRQVLVAIFLIKDMGSLKKINLICYLHVLGYIDQKRFSTYLIYFYYMHYPLLV
jgi:hypothetical protein